MKQSTINICGWITFGIVLTIYTLTLEPTTSFWDCGEFILSAAKLEVNHPSGAPFFMVLGRLFSLFSFGNPQKIAVAINFLSAFSSALTVLFLFWILVMIAKKVTDKPVFILAGAFSGSLSFAFTDSFWFSAVEGEVYALSMFFLAILIWAVFKWEAQCDKPGHTRWFYFIALVSGIGLGVHLLNLLAFPAIALVIGFREYGYSLKVLFLSFVAGCAAIFFALSGLTPFVLNMIALADRLFVNNLSQPVHSGVLTAIFLILLLFGFLICYFRKKGKELAEGITFSIILFLAGFSIYSVNIIRSNSNPPVNFGRPDNMYSLINYLNREQYPKRPLISGNNYNSPATETKDRYSWDIIEGKYQKIQLSQEVKYQKNSCTVFPRMYSIEPEHTEAYKRWIKINGKKVPAGNGTIEVPAFADQVRFFLKYQMGYMYFRYFLWNFSGRQNDIQGTGDILNGNWITGIPVLDRIRLGSQANLPGWLKHNRARNRYFLVPLLIGLAGVVFHLKNHRATFFVVLSLFVMAGAGLVVYINEIPATPRERDYVFVGSFMAFCIWIGLSVIFISKWLEKSGSGKILSTAVVLAIAALTPFLLLYQNFDDHDRSGRYTARDIPANILKSCPPDAILFTNGDNDTYPLLYCQEVENIRRDVRIVIMPFLSANWFINQLKNKKYDDKGLDMKIPQNKYDLGQLEYIPVVDKISREIKWDDALDFVKSDQPSSKVNLSDGGVYNFLPGVELFFKLRDDGKDGFIKVSLKNKRVLYKHELVFWDILASNGGHRPICFTSPTIPEKYGLIKHTKSESLIFRLVSESEPGASLINLLNCNPEKSYKQFMSDFLWGNVEKEDVNIGWDNISNIRAYQVRNLFNHLARTLILSGENQKAADVINRCLELFPCEKVPYDIFSVGQLDLLIRAGEEGGSFLLTKKLQEYYEKNLEYFASLDKTKQKLLLDEIRENLYYYSKVMDLNKDRGKVYSMLKTGFGKYLAMFQGVLN